MSLINDPIAYDTAHAIVKSVLAVPGVHDMYAGTFGEVSLLYPGERARGLRLGDDTLRVHVVADLASLGGAPLHELGERIRTAVAPLTDYAVDVIIADAV
ncbi:hypothetical protein [Corynebacterium uterequi]|uniref:Asp23/Gls24 family envelope stress response protein n=1 Tax=Corynebacterium uterequi TaxID=1072256 RepID=A0A0G3HAE2_9CORY|nr:hypothetical protein [Corynebacterium uterequi]AKK10336.1 hypothetical protein CUTER_01600 [Corynebacterium uterequi]